MISEHVIAVFVVFFLVCLFVVVDFFLASANILVVGLLACH